MLDKIKQVLAKGDVENADQLLQAFHTLSSMQQNLLHLAFQLGEDAGYEDATDADGGEAERATVIVKMNEHGGFDVAVTDGVPVNVLVVEADLCGSANMTIDEEDCIGWMTTADTDPQRVNEILSTYQG